MSSRFQPSGSQSIGLSSNNGAHVLNFENTELSSHHMNLLEAGTTKGEQQFKLRKCFSLSYCY